MTISDLTTTARTTTSRGLRALLRPVQVELSFVALSVIASVAITIKTIVLNGWSSMVLTLAGLAFASIVWFVMHRTHPKARVLESTRIEADLACWLCARLPPARPRRCRVCRPAFASALPDRSRDLRRERP